MTATYPTYRVADLVSADEAGKTIYPLQSDVTPTARLHATNGDYSGGGSWYWEVAADDAATLKAGDVILVTHGGERSVVDLYVRDGHGEGGMVAGTELCRVESVGKEYRGKRRVYSRHLTVVPAAHRS